MRGACLALMLSAAKQSKNSLLVGGAGTMRFRLQSLRYKPGSLLGSVETTYVHLHRLAMPAPSSAFRSRPCLCVRCR